MGDWKYKEKEISLGHFARKVPEFEKEQEREPTLEV